MVVKGERAETLMREVVDRLRPVMPPGTEVKVRHGRWSMSVTAHSNRSSGGMLGGGSLGRTISPWLPRQVAARVAAHDAVERVLDVVFHFDECSIKTWVADDLVHVSFRLPGEVDTPRELDPLPIDLCL